MIHFNYITTNKINGKKYIGSHSTTDVINDKYLGSGLYLLRAIKKYGKENFTKDVLNRTLTQKEAFYNEKFLIDMYMTLTPNGYNISPKGGHGIAESMAEETKQKIRLANIGKKHSKETIKKLRESHKGIYPSKESRRKMSKAAKGSTNAIGNTNTKGAKRIHNKKLNKNKTIKKEELLYYLDNGWVFGMTDKTKQKMKLKIFSKEHKRNLSKSKKGNTNTVGNINTKGTKWIHNKGLKKNKMVKVELLKEYLDYGWELGIIKISKK